MVYHLVDQMVYYLIDQLVDHLIDQLVDQLVDQLIDQLNDRRLITDQLNDLMFEQSWLEEQGKRMEKDGEYRSYV